MSKREYRFGFSPEVRGESDAPKIVGYAAVFNEETDLGYFREVVKPGAFKKSIADGSDVRALVEHDPALIIGRTKAGSLTMREDAKGLLVEIDPPDTTVGRDVVTNLRNGNLDKMSFGFYIRGEEMKKVDGQWLREITDVDLFDVSVVAFPAYDSTSVEARSKCFPDGAPEVPKERAMSDCQCTCAECKDGECADCTHEGCECKGCTCDMQMNALRKDLETRTAERDAALLEVSTVKQERDSAVAEIENAQSREALLKAERDGAEARYFEMLERSKPVIENALTALRDLDSDHGRRLRLKTLS